ncbi:MAG: putative Major Facilitator Superfamily protein [Promethearchaeota archaeon]|nr:MAG: putative Major Facilitator Superfamily protein [Candidatus Lokiarchaeota archaeon]
MSEKAKLPRNIAISVAFLSLAGQIAWAVENQFYNDFIDEALVNLGFPTLIPLAITLMVNITTSVGTLAAIIMGSYSDVKGKRKPLLLYGFIFWAITTAMFPLSALFGGINVYVVIFTAILFDSIMTFFGSMTLNAGFNSWVTDVTTLENRSKAMSIAQITTLAALLIVYGALGMLIGVIGYYNFFIVVAILTGVIGLIGVHKMKTPQDLKPMDITVGEHIKNTFKRKSSVDYKNFFLVLIVICSWQIALNIMFPFLIIYLKYALGSRTFSLLILFVALLVAIFLSYPLGKITNKLGRKKMTFISTLLFSLGLFLVGISPELITLLLSGIMTFVFYTALSISTFTWVKDLYPAEGRGQFSGYWNLFSGTIPMIIGPIIGGILVSVFGELRMEELGRIVLVPPDIIFYIAAFFALITLLPLIFAKELKKG